MNGCQSMKNLAGNEISIFLFRFDLKSEGIDFVINESISADMYPDLDEKMNPLVHACCETLLRYKHLSAGNTIMDGNILDTGEFEVMLSKGLGKYFREEEKQNLFKDAADIHYILVEVMDRKTKELEEIKSHKKRKVDNPSDVKKKEEQIFHPITMLPFILQLLIKKVEQLKSDYNNILMAKPKPHVLDDHTIQRGLKLYRDEKELLSCYPIQLEKWKKEEKLKPYEIRMIKEAYINLETIEKQLTDILTLLVELEKGTIEKVMAKSDLAMGLEALKMGLMNHLENPPVRPGLKQIRPEDLPKGVTASRGYDHRGHCLEFSHKTLGNLGKIVLIQVPGGQMLIQADLNIGQGKLTNTNVEKKKKVFEEVVAVVHKGFKENFPE